MEIFVTVKDVYGVRKIYPACDRAQAFARIAGTKTLTNEAVEAIKELGYTVSVRQSAPATL